MTDSTDRNKSRSEKNDHQEDDSRGQMPPHGTVFGRRFLILLVIILLISFLYVVKTFIIPVLIAGVFAGLFYPLYKWFLKVFKNKKQLASIIACLALLLGLIIPLVFLGKLVADEAINLYYTAESKIETIIEQGEQGPLGWLKDKWPEDVISLEDVQWQQHVGKAASTGGQVIATVLNNTWQNALTFIVQLAVIVFTMYYFFMDGPALLKRLSYLSPLEDLQEEMLYKRFASVSKATIKGSLLIGIIQGGLGGVAMLIAGVESLILWSVLMVILSVIPLLGAGLVLVPAGIIQLIQGEIWQGILLILMQFVVVANIDNLLRPRLIGRDAKMHDLLILFSTLGGITAFGMMGFIVGPILCAMLLTVLDIYGIEFREQLEHAPLTGSLEEEEEEK